MKRRKPRYIVDILCLDGGEEEPQTLRLHFPHSPRRKARLEAKAVARQLLVPFSLLCFDEPSVNAKPIQRATWHHFHCMNGMDRRAARSHRQVAITGVGQ